MQFLRHGAIYLGHCPKLPFFSEMSYYIRSNKCIDLIIFVYSDWMRTKQYLRFFNKFVHDISRKNGNWGMQSDFLNYQWVCNKYFNIIFTDSLQFYFSYYKNRLWRNEVAYKKRQRAKKRREMELLMRDNLLNILTVPGMIFKNPFKTV